MQLDDYGRIRDSYLSLKDNDPISAYTLMQEASALLALYEEEVARYESKAGLHKQQVEAAESRAVVSFGRPIGEAEHRAKSDPHVENGWKLYWEGREFLNKLKAAAAFLGRVYFDSKGVWEQGSRNIQRN